MSTENLSTDLSTLGINTGYHELKSEKYAERRQARESLWSFFDAAMEFPGQWTGDMCAFYYCNENKSLLLFHNDEWDMGNVLAMEQKWFTTRNEGSTSRSGFGSRYAIEKICSNDITTEIIKAKYYIINNLQDDEKIQGLLEVDGAVGINSRNLNDDDKLEINKSLSYLFNSNENIIHNLKHYTLVKLPLGKDIFTKYFSEETLIKETQKTLNTRIIKFFNRNALNRNFFLNGKKLEFNKKHILAKDPIVIKCRILSGYYSSTTKEEEKKTFWMKIDNFDDITDFFPNLKRSFTLPRCVDDFDPNKFRNLSTDGIKTNNPEGLKLEETFTIRYCFIDKKENEEQIKYYNCKGNQSLLNGINIYINDNCINPISIQEHIQRQKPPFVITPEKWNQHYWRNEVEITNQKSLIVQFPVERYRTSFTSIGKIAVIKFIGWLFNKGGHNKEVFDSTFSIPTTTAPPVVTTTAVVTPGPSTVKPTTQGPLPVNPTTTQGPSPVNPVTPGPSPVNPATPGPSPVNPVTPGPSPVNPVTPGPSPEPEPPAPAIEPKFSSREGGYYFGLYTAWYKNNDDRWNIDGYVRCPMCDRKLYEQNMNCGHIIARAKGGKPEEKNALPICCTCNNQGDKTRSITQNVYEEWGEEHENYKRLIKVLKENDKNIPNIIK